MKLLIALAVLAVGLVAADVGDLCATGADCGAEEGCVSFTSPKGKRGLVGGSCQRLGRDKDTCITNSPTLTTVGGKPEEMVFTAPCSTGYNCMASATSPFLIPLGRQGNCVRAQRAVGMTCVSGNDCAADECCVSKMRPLGKRQLGGSCQKLKNANEGGCFVNQPNGKPETMVYGCPCRQGLSCNPGPIPMFDIPLGQVGTCQ